MRNPTWQIVVMACFTVGCIGGLEAWALHLGHDGTVLAGTVALMGGIAGGVCGFTLRGTRREKE
jgi:hypothetical protein